jgi:hypothetical protein
MHLRNPDLLSRLCLLVATGNVFSGSGTDFHTKVRRHKERLRYTSVQPPGPSEGCTHPLQRINTMWSHDRVQDAQEAFYPALVEFLWLQGMCLREAGRFSPPRHGGIEKAPPYFFSTTRPPGSPVRVERTHYNESIQCGATRRHKMHMRNPDLFSRLCLLVATGNVFSGSGTDFHTKVRRHKEGSAILLFNRQDASEC